MTRKTPAPFRRRLAAVAAVATAAVTAVALAGPAIASPPDNNGQPVVGKPVQYTTHDPNFDWTNSCTTKGSPFTATTYTDSSGATRTSRVLTGIRNGAAYRVEVPADWNGDLVLYAHGYAGTGTDLCVGVPSISRGWYMSHGYAWAASSYSTNGYDIPTGVKDTHALIPIFTSKVGAPKHVWMTGDSMGGHITASSIEQYPNSFSGAMPTCGVLGDQKLFDYFYDANATASALAGVGQEMPYPTTNAEYTAFVQGKLGMTRGGTTIGGSAATYQAWAATVVNASGGYRPGAFNALYGYWNYPGFGESPIDQLPFLIGLYPGTTNGTLGIAHGNVVDNTDTVYRTSFDPSAPLSPAEQQLNAAVKRISADPSATNNGLNGVPVVHGTPTVPVLSLHGTADLFVPFLMEQVYHDRVAANGRSDLLVQRAIRSVAHCGFTQAEYTDAFTSLVSWAEGGPRPAGDMVTDKAALASPTYGCQFTDQSPAALATFERSAAFFPTPCPTS